MSDNVIPLVQQPQTLGAEQAILGACLMDARAFDIATGIISSRDFAEQAHRLIWDAMAKGRADGRSLDMRLVAATLGSSAGEMIDGLGVTVGQYVARLAADAVSVQDAADFARAIKDTSDVRQLLAVASEITAGARDGLAADPESIAAEAIETLDGIVQSRSRTSTPRVSLGAAAERALEEARRVATDQRQRGVTTGLEGLDRMILGLREGKLYVLAGRPGMGKTMLALSIGMSAARRGVGVYFVSLEMDDAEMSERAMSSEIERLTGNVVPYQDLASYRFPRERDADVGQALASIRDLPIVIEQEPGLTIGQIRARARQTRTQMEARGVKLGLIITDHMGLVRASDHYRGNKVAEAGEVSNAHKAMAKEFGLPVLALCQLNRDVEKQEDKRPGLSDLRWSGEIEQDADCIIFPFREAYYLGREKNPTPDQALRLAQCQNEMEIHIAKNRGGPEGRFEAYCNPACNVVRDKEWRR